LADALTRTAACNRAISPSLGCPGCTHIARWRLFITAGTWAAGLCLVIGSIVLVSSAGPGRMAGVATRASHLAAPRAAAGRDGTGRTSLRSGSDTRGNLARGGRDRGANRSLARRGTSHRTTRALAGVSRLIAAFAGQGDASTSRFRVSDKAGGRFGGPTSARPASR